MRNTCKGLIGVRLRDMGLKPKALIEAAAAEGINLSKRRASEIINGQTFIKPEEMKVVSKLVNKSVDDLYIELGSVLAVVCPLSFSSKDGIFPCLRQRCAWWDWEKQWCCHKNNTVIGVDKHERTS